MSKYSYALKAGLIAALFFQVIFLNASEIAQNPNGFVANYQDMARRVAARTQIPVSIVLGQALLESGSGTSEVSKRTNNFFGIRTKEAYQVFETDEASFQRYAHILSKRNRYAHLFDLHPLDFIAWAEGIARSGYAEDPDYAKKLIQVIKRNKLYKLDEQQPIQLNLTDTTMIQRDHMLGEQILFSRESLAYLAMQAEQERNKNTRKLKKAPHISRRELRKISLRLEKNPNTSHL
jgi:Mannosyl-glycoprotein endo-beta-N-acetylglucosaminidase